MSFQVDHASAHEFEISIRFRHAIEARIARLESDANHDEAMLVNLVSNDHMRRQMRLVAVQRDEAARMRRFLDQSKTRAPRPMIAI